MGSDRPFDEFEKSDESSARRSALREDRRRARTEAVKGHRRGRHKAFTDLRPWLAAGELNSKTAERTAETIKRLGKSVRTVPALYGL